MIMIINEKSFRMRAPEATFLHFLFYFCILTLHCTYRAYIIILFAPCILSISRFKGGYNQKEEAFCTRVAVLLAL